MGEPEKRSLVIRQQPEHFGVPTRGGDIFILRKSRLALRPEQPPIKEQMDSIHRSKTARTLR